jgi:multisubunit Na+/H+ antiporter MnhB subunit
MYEIVQHFLTKSAVYPRFHLMNYHTRTQHILLFIFGFMLCCFAVFLPQFAHGRTGDYDGYDTRDAYGVSDAQILAQSYLAKINEAILFPLIALMMAVAMLVFLYGGFEYVRGASNESDREKGRRHLLYGIIGLFVMLSALTILSVAAGTFNLNTELDKAMNEGKIDSL